MDKKKILSAVDHTLLSQTARWEEIKKICDDAVSYGTASVCIPPSYVKRAKEYLGDRMAVCTVIGFPNGYQTEAVKVFETRDAIENGADEIDMVINLGDVKDGNYQKVEEEIRRVSGVEQGDNLFTLNKYQISSRIYTQLPYIGTVNFERKYPDTFVIHVTASVPVAWIESGGSRWLMDTDCKLLESGGASLTEGKAQVRGLEAVNPSVGSVLTVPPEQQDKLDQLKGFLAAIQARQMTGSLTSFLDLTSNNEIRFGYGANLTVLFPMNGDFTQKTYYLQQTLWTMDEKGIPRTGTLDLTYDNQEGHLLPKRWLPEASTAPELSPPPAAEAGTQGENDANEKTDAE